MKSLRSIATLLLPLLACGDNNLGQVTTASTGADSHPDSSTAADVATAIPTSSAESGSDTATGGEATSSDGESTTSDVSCGSGTPWGDVTPIDGIRLWATAIDAKGNVYAGGRFNNSQYRILKYDPEGTLLWPSKDASGDVQALLVDNGNLYIGGHAPEGAFIRRMDSNGNDVPFPNDPILPGGSAVAVQDMVVDKTGFIHAVGTCRDLQDEPGLLIIKFDPSEGLTVEGACEGTVPGGGTPDEDHQYRASIAIDDTVPNPQIVVAGALHGAFENEAVKDFVTGPEGSSATMGFVARYPFDAGAFNLLIPGHPEMASVNTLARAPDGSFLIGGRISHDEPDVTDCPEAPPCPAPLTASSGYIAALDANLACTGIRVLCSDGIYSEEVHDIVAGPNGFFVTGQFEGRLSLNGTEPLCHAADKGIRAFMFAVDTQLNLTLPGNILVSEGNADTIQMGRGLAFDQATGTVAWVGLTQEGVGRLNGTEFAASFVATLHP